LQLSRVRQFFKDIALLAILKSIVDFQRYRIFPDIELVAFALLTWDFQEYQACHARAPCSLFLEI
jgi:hypothetical protein